MSEQGLSNESLSEWQGFVDSLGPDASSPVAQERLNQFLIGVHRRGENLYAHELKSLLDDTNLPRDVARELISFVGPALALLAEYDVALGAAEDDDDDLAGSYLDGDDEFGVEEGVLVI